MGWPPNQAKGFLATLWHHSQEAGQTHGDPDEICAWGEEFEDPIKLINCLCHKTVRYLIPCENGRYEITGNYAQIEGTRAFKEMKSKAGKKGAEARWGKAEAKQPHGSAIANDGQFNAMQCNAMQGKEKKLTQKKADPAQKKADSPPAQTKPKSKPKRKSTQRPLTRTWEADHPFAYAFTHLQRLAPYKVVFDTPTDNDKLAGFVKEFGFDIQTVNEYTRAFVEYYLEEPEKVRNPRGRLFTWMNNRRDWKREKEANKKPPTKKEIKAQIEYENNQAYLANMTPEEREKPF
jgi:hypothetical protein